jgi:hypothetical protein
MKYLVLLIALFAFTATSCDRSGAPTQAGAGNTSLLKATQDRLVDINFQFRDICCDDVISGTLTEHIVNNNNGLHINFTSMKGTGLNGDSYTGNFHVGESDNLNENTGIRQLTETLELTLTSPNGCKVRLHITVHIVVDADGTVTTTVENITSQCTDLFL